MELAKLTILALWLCLIGTAESILMLPLDVNEEGAKQLIESCPSLREPWANYLTCTDIFQREETHPSIICSKVLKSIVCHEPLVRSLRECPHAQAEAFVTMSKIFVEQWKYLCYNGGYRAIELSALFFEKEVCLKPGPPKCRYNETDTIVAPFHKETCGFWRESSECLRDTWRTCPHQVKDIFDHLYEFVADIVCAQTGDSHTDSTDIYADTAAPATATDDAILNDSTPREESDDVTLTTSPPPQPTRKASALRGRKKRL